MACAPLLQIVRRFIDARRDVLNHLRNLRNLRVGFLPFLLIHVFPDGGDRLRAVTGVGARRVNLVLEPGTFRKSLFIQEQSGNFQQVGVDQLAATAAERRANPWHANPTRLWNIAPNSS